MSFFILLNGNLNHHSFTYLGAEGQRLEPTLVPTHRPARFSAEAHKSWVLHLMSKEVVTLTPEDSVNKAVEAFKKLKVHHLPIVKEGKLVGMISDRDIMWLHQIYADKSTTLDRFMSKIVVVCHEETPIDHLAKVFYSEGINGMPVINDQHYLVGIITHRDLLRWIFEGD